MKSMGEHRMLQIFLAFWQFFYPHLLAQIFNSFVIFLVANLKTRKSVNYLS